MIFNYEDFVNEGEIYVSLPGTCLIYFQKLCVRLNVPFLQNIQIKIKNLLSDITTSVITLNSINVACNPPQCS